jgi:hypothetical protein
MVVMWLLNEQNPGFSSDQTAWPGGAFVVVERANSQVRLMRIGRLLY